MLSDQDIYLFGEGTHSRLYRSLGCQWRDGVAEFAVWAPNASCVAVVGEWNGWNPEADVLSRRPDGSGIWEGRSSAAQHGHVYKYRISAQGRHVADKADPFAIYAEVAPANGSRIWSLDHDWNDRDWMERRARRNALDAPMSIYEMHIGSWRRPDGQPMGYRDIALPLADHIESCGFTHVELMPITEHPFYGSWGYQTTGYFAASSRYGTPQDLMFLVDHLHQRGIGVILDWVPSHFPTDAHGLAGFDGTHLYEHADPRQGFHPEWNSSIFNYGRHEVASFLISSALFWLDKYHFDGLRVDAVASMLYLDYARRHGEWVPNQHGGRENLEAVHFLQKLNEAVHRDYPDTLTIAEESTAWPRVSRPSSTGGLGFDMKWNMGWMHDTLSFAQQDPLYRQHHLGQLTFSLVYAFNENFVLPLSHDEVVYGKKSLIDKMPGDAWQQFANLRALYGLMWGHPGKKLLYMGGEFAQRREWTHEGQLDWALAAQPAHEGVRRTVAQLNRLLRDEPALHELDFSPAGFEWIEPNDTANTVVSFLRRPKDGGTPVLVVCNFTPIPRENYVVGVPSGGYWREIFNSDAADYGGGGWGNWGGRGAEPTPAHGRSHLLRLTLPPLSTVMFKPEEAVPAQPQAKGDVLG